MIDKEWSPIAQRYDPILAGSIDATDVEPHDRGIVRALNSRYKPNIAVQGDPDCTIFIGRLNYVTNEDQIRNLVSKYGQIKRCRLVRDFITGFSRGYCFVEYANRSDAKYAINKLNHTVLDDKTIIVMFECERKLPGWIPRRLGGGLGGKKESGQLRFGGVERPFRKPITIPSRCGSDATSRADVGKATVTQVPDHERNGKKYLHSLSSNVSGEVIKSSRVESGKDTRNKSQERKHGSIQNSSRKHGHYHNGDKRNGSDRVDHDNAHRKHSTDSKRRKRSRSRDSSQKRFRSDTNSRKIQNSNSSREMLSQHDKEKTPRSSHNRNSSRYKDHERKRSRSPRRFVRSQLSLTPE